MPNNSLSKIKYILVEEGLINLIRRIARYLAYRIKRLSKSSQNDIKKWEVLKSKTTGKRAFFIGGGPSLNKTPLHLLENEATLCANRFNLMFDRLNWRPSMYTVADDVVMLDMIDELDEIKDDVEALFLPDIHPSAPISVNYQKLIGNSENIYWYHLDKMVFSNELPSIGLNKTVTNVAIQILVYLGYKEIYLLGIDHDYGAHDKVSNLDNRHLESTVDNDPNHFDPRYFGSGRKYHIPRLDETLEKYKEAKIFAEKNGVTIFNATVGGKLEVFERVDLKSLFAYSLESELDLIMNVLGLNNAGHEQFIDAFPSAIKISREDQWDETAKEIIVPAEIGFKLIPKYVLTYLPLGPFNNEYLFVKRG